MRKLLPVIIVIFFQFEVAPAQILRQIIDAGRDRVVDALKDEAVNQLRKSYEEYDQTEFNYAVSFSDNSGMFESQERYRKLQRVLLFVLTPESYADRSPAEKAEDLNQAGEMFYASGRFRSAELSFNSALEIYRFNNMYPSKEAASVISNLGLLHHATGRYGSAGDLTVEAMEMRARTVADESTLGASYNNLAVLYKDMGRYAEAQEYYEKAVENIYRYQGGNSVPYAIALNNQAIFYQVTGRYNEAEELLTRAVEVASGQLGERSANFLRMKVNLALLYQLLEEYDEAEKIYLEALAAKRRRLGAGHPDYAVMLRNIASLYMVTGEMDKVEENLVNALDIYRRRLGRDNPHYAATASELAGFYLMTGNTGAALPLLEEALEIEKESLDDHHPNHISTIERMAVLRWQEGDYQDAYEWYTRVLDRHLHQIDRHFPAMSDTEKARFWARIQPRFIRFNSFSVDAEDHIDGISGDMYDYHIAVKALLLNATTRVRNQILSSGDSELVGRFREWLDIREYLAYLYTLPREDLAEDNINMDSLENEANRMERELSRMSDAFEEGYSTRRVSYRDIADALYDNEAAMEIIRFRRYNYLRPDTLVYYASLVVDRDMDQPSVTVFRNGNEMETVYAAEYRRIMERALEDDDLGKIYWGELSSVTEGYSDLYISLDGVFNQINLLTLKDEDGSYLIGKMRMFYVPNTRIIAEQPRQDPDAFRGEGYAVLVGDPNYSLGVDWDLVTTMPLPELPGTREEVEIIDRLFTSAGWNTSVYLNDMATETNIRRVRSPDILHVATHGFFLDDIDAGSGETVLGIEPEKAVENPLLRSGLMLAGADNTIQQIGTVNIADGDDGILNAYEAMLLDLSSTRLVVLSACETGLGEVINGEGVYGLQRAFQVAGSGTVILSLWQVSDEITQMLMSEFYRKWLEKGDKSIAFREAQLSVMENYSSPFYWGAFVMIGNRAPAR